MLEKMTVIVIIIIIIIIIISLYRISRPCNKHCFFFSIQFNSIHTSIKYLHHIYTNKGEEEGKKKINGLDRNARWSEELSFRANHGYIFGGNT